MLSLDLPPLVYPFWYSYVANREVVPFVAARPPRVIDEKAAISKAETRTRKRLPRYIKKLEELGAGVYLIEPKHTGGNDTELILRASDGSERVLGTNVVVYQTPPDLKALQYLVDRAMGKSPQRYEITGKDGGGVQVVPWMPALAIPDDEVVDGDAREI